ncbi:MAG: cell division protein PerM, partial [Janthinobacterium lividum]
MASLTSPRRPDAPERHRVVLEASEAVRDVDETEVDPVSWPVAAVVGGLATAVVGWVLVTGLVVCGWLMGDDAGLPSALELGTRLWLLGGGVPVTVGSLEVTLVPWGLTVVTAALLWRFGGYAARRVMPGSSTGPFAVALVVTLAYVLPVLGAAAFFGEPWRAPGRWAAIVLVLLVATWAGAGSRVGRPAGSSWPTLLTGLPRAVAGAVGVLLLAGVAVLTLGLVSGWDRVVDLSTALQAGTAGTVLLVVVQATVLPNALVWSGSYALGAGFSLGNGSVVAPAATSLGVL